MFKEVIVLACFLALTIASPVPDSDIIEDADGQQFYLVPVEYDESDNHIRNRRQVTSGNIDNKGFAVSHTQPLFNNNRHKLEGTASAAKNWGGPLSTGAGLDYQHKSGFNAGANAVHTQKWGTNVNANAGYNFIKSRDGKTTAGLSATYNQQFGGPFGRQRPNVGGMFNFRHRF